MDTNKNSKTDDILSSLDNITPARVPAFFYTRLKARMEKESYTESRPSWMLRPVYALAALMLVLAINAFVIFRGSNADSAADSVSASTTIEAENMQSLASEFSLNETASLVELNQEVK